MDDGISGISDGEKTKSGGLSGKGEVNAGLVSDFMAERKSNGAEPVKIERNLEENGSSNGSSSGATEDKGISANPNRSRRGTERTDPRSDQNGKVGITDDECRHSFKVSHDNSARDSTSSGLNIKRPAYFSSDNDNSPEEDLFARSLRSRPSINQSIVDRTSSVALHTNGNGFSGQRRFAKCPYPDEGPSNYGRSSLYNYGDYMTYSDHLDGIARVENLENDRAELLRKLDELADQLSRSCDVPEKPRDRNFHDRRIPPVPLEAYGRHEAFIQEGASMSYGVNNKPPVPDKHVSRPPYFANSHGYSIMDRHGLAVPEPYPSTNRMQDYRGFADVYQPPQVLRRPSHQLPHQYFQEPDYEHFPGRYMDFNQDPFMSHPHETFFHQPACSCLHCLNKNWHAPHKTQPPNFANQNAGNNYMHRIPYPPVNPVPYGLQGYMSEGCSLQQPHSRDRLPLTRSSSDLGRETGGFGRRHLKKVLVAHGNARIFHPVAGGAPFITCCNCWELLKVPKKIMSVQKTHRKIKCGACSSILMFEIEGKGIVVSAPVETVPVTMNIAAAAANEIPAENFRNSTDFSDTCAINTSNEYENFNYDFQLVDDEPDPSFGDHRLNSSAHDMEQDPQSSSSSSSEDEQSQDDLIVRKDVSHFAKDEACLPVPDSTSQECPDLSYSDEVMQRNGNNSKRIDEDKNLQDEIISRQDSLKDAMVATETDISYTDNFDTGVSRDSDEARKDEDHRPRSNKGAESFFVGLIKRSFGDFSRSSKTTERGRSNVSINGHLIPDRVVKKAEKCAGPIQPGDYW